MADQTEHEIWRCPNGCRPAKPAWWPPPPGGIAPPCSNCDAPLDPAGVPLVEDGELMAVYVCDLCGQPVSGKDARCNSGVHQGPKDPNGFRGRATLTTELVHRYRELLDSR